MQPCLLDTYTVSSVSPTAYHHNHVSQTVGTRIKQVHIDTMATQNVLRRNQNSPTHTDITTSSDSYIQNTMRNVLGSTPSVATLKQNGKAKCSLTTMRDKPISNLPRKDGNASTGRHIEYPTHRTSSAPLTPPYPTPPKPMEISTRFEVPLKAVVSGTAKERLSGIFRDKCGEASVAHRLDTYSENKMSWSGSDSEGVVRNESGYECASDNEIEDYDWDDLDTTMNDVGVLVQNYAKRTRTHTGCQSSHAPVCKDKFTKSTAATAPVQNEDERNSEKEKKLDGASYMNIDNHGCHGDDSCCCMDGMQRTNVNGTPIVGGMVLPKRTNVNTSASVSIFMDVSENTAVQTPPPEDPVLMEAQTNTQRPKSPPPDALSPSPPLVFYSYSGRHVPYTHAHKHTMTHTHYHEHDHAHLKTHTHDHSPEYRTHRPYADCDSHKKPTTTTQHSTDSEDVFTGPLKDIRVNAKQGSPRSLVRNPVCLGGVRFCDSVMMVPLPENDDTRSARMGTWVQDAMREMRNLQIVQDAATTATTTTTGTTFTATATTTSSDAATVSTTTSARTTPSTTNVNSLEDIPKYSDYMMSDISSTSDLNSSKRIQSVQTRDFTSSLTSTYMPHAKVVYVQHVREFKPHTYTNVSTSKTAIQHTGPESASGKQGEGVMVKSIEMGSGVGVGIGIGTTMDEAIQAAVRAGVESTTGSNVHFSTKNGNISANVEDVMRDLVPIVEGTIPVYPGPVCPGKHNCAICRPEYSYSDWIMEVEKREKLWMHKNHLCQCYK